MITILKVIIGFLLLCAIPGTIMGLISAYRAGQLQRDWGPAYFKYKKIAQQKFFNRTTWRHIKSYYMYYGLALILLVSAITQ